MQLYDPTAPRPQRQVFRAQALAGLEGKTLGLLENGKLNAEVMLREVAVLFEQRHGCTVRAVYSKLNASAPAPAETLAQAAKEVDFLITGLGD